MQIFSTAVLIKYKSAFNCCASRPLARSLSMTAYTPANSRNSPFVLWITGMPPPPTAITMLPAATNVRIASSSITRNGMGEATTRRQPRPESSTTFQPSFSYFRASSSLIKPPIGLLAFSKAGSSLRTNTCVTTETTGLRMSRLYSSFRNACCNIYPIDPCVSATIMSSGVVCTSSAAISLRRMM